MKFLYFDEFQYDPQNDGWPPPSNSMMTCGTWAARVFQLRKSHQSFAHNVGSKHSHPALDVRRMYHFILAVNSITQLKHSPGVSIYCIQYYSEKYSILIRSIHSFWREIQPQCIRIQLHTVFDWKYPKFSSVTLIFLTFTGFCFCSQAQNFMYKLIL